MRKDDVKRYIGWLFKVTEWVSIITIKLNNIVLTYHPHFLI